MNIYFAIAAGLSVFNCLLHTFVGGKQIARPLLEYQGLPKSQKYVLYFCWHISTLALAALVAGFTYAALAPDNPVLALAATVFAGSIALLGVGIPLVFSDVTFKDVPQGWLFVPVTLLGMAGLYL